MAEQTLILDVPSCSIYRATNVMLAETIPEKYSKDEHSYRLI